MPEPTPPASAHRALVDCLMTINGSAGDARIKIYAMRAKVVAATEDAGELVAVELKLGFHAASGTLAQRAFDDAQDALEKLSKRTTDRQHRYKDSTEALLNVLGFPPAGPLGPAGGTHIGTLTVELPAAAVTQPSNLGDLFQRAESEQVSDASAIPTYARSIAMSDNVRCPLTIDKLGREDAGAEAFELRPKWNDGLFSKARGLDRVRIVNLMHLLEDSSAKVNIISVQISEASDDRGNDGFRALKLKLALLD